MREHFLLNFGTLDYVVLVYLQKHLQPTEFERLREKHFTDRAIRLAEYLREEKYPEDKQSDFESLLMGIDQMRDLRNHSHIHIYTIGLAPQRLGSRVFATG
jgi:hypothetical protein